ncbi:MAG: hypothetical protein Kow0031_15190 [Anaerolineae bacterium]
MLAFALRLYRLTWVPLINDEAKTIIRFVALPLTDIFQQFGSNNHPLASALAHIFSPNIDHLFMLRWPMVLVGMLALPFFYRLGAALCGRWGGALALLLLAVSPMQWGYSLTVRGYGGLITLTTASLFFLYLAIRRNRWQAWFGFLVASLLAVLFHLFAVVAVALQIGLAGVLLLRDYGWRPAGRQRLARLALVAAGVMAGYALLVLPQTSAIVTEESWRGEFYTWSDGYFSLPEDSRPLLQLLQLFGLLGPWYAGVILYGLMFFVGALHVTRQRPFYGLLLFAGFATPLAAIFIAENLYQPFYAYVRFLVFLLPVYLLLVVVGIIATVNFLSRLSRLGQWPPAALAGVTLLVLIAISTRWHILRNTAINWPALGAAISTQLKPGDIIVCEEHQRGYLIPDEVKAYCMWMVKLHLPEVEMYSERFQSTVDYIADFEHIREQRETLVEPGGVWLVSWQKSTFDPGEPSPVEPPKFTPHWPPAAFDGYPAEGFGNAALIYVNSEPSLLENVVRSLETLLRVEPSSRDHSRYYRDLAEIAAARGRKQEASAFFDKTWATVEQAGGEYPELFLLETGPLVERLPDSFPPPAAAHVLNQPMADGLCLAAFEIEPVDLAPAQPVLLTLYWRTTAFLNVDYTFLLNIAPLNGGPAVQIPIEPFDRTYPTPWWWTDRWVVEPLNLIVPPELPVQNYRVTLGVVERGRAAAESAVPLFGLQANSAGWQVMPVTPAAPEKCR